MSDDGVGGRPGVVDGPLIGPSPPQAVTVPRLGSLRWAELVVFAVAGGWVGSTAEAAPRVALAAVSRHAARRADVLADRLPSAGPFEASVVTAPAADALVDLAADLETLDSTFDRLVVLGDVVLPGIAESLESLVATLSPVADATSLRTLPPLVVDLRADAHALRTCVRASWGDAASATVGAFAERLASAGGW